MSLITHPIGIWRLSGRPRRRPFLVIAGYARTVEEALAWVRKERITPGRHVIGLRVQLPFRAPRRRWGH